MNVFFMSIIGPKTRKARSAPFVKVGPNDEATKASAEEQTDRTYAKPIITPGAKIVLVPIDNRRLRSKNV